MKIHHIGYLVKYIESAVIEFGKLGYKIETAIVFDKTRHVDICFMTYSGRERIELVSPKDDASPVYGLMRKYKNSPYHICYESMSFNDDIDRLTKNGFVMFIEPSIAPAINNRKVAFMINRNIGMIEILESEDKE